MKGMRNTPKANRHSVLAFVNGSHHCDINILYPMVLRIMKRLFSSVFALSAVVAPVFLFAGNASAQTINPKPTGTNAAYLGAGISAGVTNGGSLNYNDDAQFGGNVQGRYAIPRTPISARGALLFGGDTVSVIPSLSYDIPVSNNTNLYLGAGYSFVGKEGKSTPLGNKDAVVLSTGVESQVTNRVVLYGDVKVGLDAYKDSSAAASSIQAGAAYRFN